MRGLTPNILAHMGMPYQTVYKQYHGFREVTPEYAMRYESMAGIPKREIRPDIWTDENLSEAIAEDNENVAQGV